VGSTPTSLVVHIIPLYFFINLFTDVNNFHRNKKPQLNEGFRNNEKQQNYISEFLYSLNWDQLFNKHINYVFWDLKWVFLKNNLFFLKFVDLFFYKAFNIFFSFKYGNFYIINLKLLQQNNHYFSNKSTNINNYFSFFFFGFFSITSSLTIWLLPVLVSLFFFYFMFFLKSLPFLKLFFQYFLVGMLFYLLISGFVFFIKRYQYRLYTSVIQRFWRRSLIFFWLIEGSLFIVFFYLTLNSNQEPIYMYDNIQFYKTHLFSWKLFFIKILPITLVIVFLYFLLLSLKYFTFNKLNFFSLLITFLILFICWSEFCQLYFILTYYGVVNWSYDVEEHLYTLDIELKRTRLLNHYTTICLIAKFWHIVFAFIFWVFFILRGLEIERFRYPLLSANLQNFIIVYMMSWMYMYPWFKFVFRKFLDIPYYWFFVNNRRLGFFLFFNDLKLFFLGFTNFFKNNFFLTSFFYKNYYFI
jgi:hypothetical protein